MPEAEKFETTALATFIEEHLEPTTIDVKAPDGATAQVLLAPKGFVPVDVKAYVDKHRTKPERIIGTSRHTTLDSFVAHVVRFADKESSLFAVKEVSKPQLIAVYDYHPTVAEEDGVAAAEARFGGHRAIYDFPLSEEWKTWTSQHGQKMTQAQFAEFLENHIHDVADPLSALEDTKRLMESLLCKFAAPGTLMDLSRGLSVRVESRIVQQQKLASGETSFRYDTAHMDEQGAPLSIPGAFLVSIPVFRGGAAYQLAARLRYRVSETKATWFFELHRALETFDHAFEQASEQAKTETELPLFYGTPEA